jgi:hypothetical protein
LRQTTIGSNIHLSIIRNSFGAWRWLGRPFVKVGVSWVEELDKTWSDTDWELRRKADESGTRLGLQARRMLASRYDGRPTIRQPARTRFGMFSQPRLVSRIRASTLCQRDTSISTAWQAIGWWESRRVAFNLIVGSAGVLSSLIVGIVGLGSHYLFDSDFGVPGSPLLTVFAVVIYAIMANVCYTGGWVAELSIRKAWPEEADRFATLTFALGIVFAVLLTLSPAVLVGAFGLFGLVGHLGHLLGVVHSVHS